MPPTGAYELALIETMLKETSEALAKTGLDEETLLQAFDNKALNVFTKRYEVPHAPLNTFIYFELVKLFPINEENEDLYDRIAEFLGMDNDKCEACQEKAKKLSELEKKFEEWENNMFSTLIPNKKEE